MDHLRRTLFIIFVVGLLLSCGPSGLQTPEIGSSPLELDLGLIDALPSVPQLSPPNPQRKEQVFEGNIHKEIAQRIADEPEEEQHILIEVRNPQDKQRIRELVERYDGEIAADLELAQSIEVILDGEAIRSIAQDTETVMWPDRNYTILLTDATPLVNLPLVWGMNRSGKGIRIAILDTGVDDTHEMLQGRIILARDFTPSGSTLDRNGHGSHVAGIAAGNGSLIGAAPGAEIINAKVLDDSGAGTTSSIISGISWVLDPDGDSSTDDGADIISISFGGPYHDPDGPLRSALLEAIHRGVVVVAASGNCALGCGSFRGVTTPGDIKEIITVGAVDDGLAIAPFSSGENLGSYIKPDVVAPGVGIRSSVPTGIESKSGTSMSAPLVSGITALMLEQSPELSPAQVKQLLEDRARDLGAPGKDTLYGSGVVDASTLFGPGLIVYPEPSTLSINATSPFVLTNRGLLPLVLDVDSAQATLSATLLDPWQNATLTITPLDAGEIHLLSNDKNITFTTIQQQESTPSSEIEAGSLEPLSKEMRNLFKGYPQNYSEPAVNATGIDDQEWPGTCSGAAAISGPTSGVLGFPYDEDWFKITVPSAGTLSVSLDVPAGVDYLFEFQDSCSSAPLPCDEGYAGADEECTFNIPSGRTVFINVQGYGGWDFDTNDDYTLDYTFTASNSQGGLWLELDNGNNAHTYNVGIKLDGVSRGEVGLESGQHNRFGPGGEPFVVTGDQDHSFSLTFFDETSGLSFSKQKTTYVPAQSTKTAYFTTAQCGDNRCTNEETLSSCSQDCSAPTVRADSRCAAQTQSGGPCYGDIDDYLGHNNQYHSPSGPLLEPFPSFVCYDWWYEPGSSGGPITYDNHGWDYCVGSCPQCASGDPRSPLILTDASAGSRTNRVLVAGWDGTHHVFDQDSLDFVINIPSVCGNDICEDDETTTSCSSDCFSDIRILDYVTAPDTVTEGQNVAVNVKVKNIGSVQGTVRMESAIIPTGFFSSGISATSFKPVTGCCEQNRYYDTLEVTLAPGADQVITFDIEAPNRESIDSCSPTSKSAWGSSFVLITGSYPQCGSALYDVQRKSVSVSAECRSDQDCSAHGPGYVCDFTPNPNQCAYRDPCPNPCTEGSYSCDTEGDVTVCGKQNDGCTAYKKIRYCGEGSYCSIGESSCRADDKTTTLQLEYGVGNVDVFKQPGDLLAITLLHDQDESVDIEYDPGVLTPLTGGCESSLQIRAPHICTFSVAPTASGKTTISIYGGDAKTVTIINATPTIYVTDTVKLHERFADASSRVDSLLEQTYSQASGQHAVVYDLSQYLDDHLFSRYDSYSEGLLSPLHTDNSYAGDVARFISTKCKTCTSTIILGDDYVVPHYRVDYSSLRWGFGKGSWFGTNTNWIYSDQPYIKEVKKPVSDVNTIFESGSDVTILTPAQVTPELSTAISTLSATLRQEYGVDDIEIRSSTGTACDEWGLGSSHLILIGDRTNNDAIKCVPWFDIGYDPSRDTFEASIDIERNVWARNKYAFVVSGPRPERGIISLNQILNNPFLYKGGFLDQTSTVYMHDVSIPDTSLGQGDILWGIVSGNCEGTEQFSDISTCIGGDFALSIAPVTSAITDARDAAIYCGTSIVKIISRETAYFDEFICVASGIGLGSEVGGLISSPTIAGYAASKIPDSIAAAFKATAKTIRAIYKSNAEKIITTLKASGAFTHTKALQFLNILKPGESYLDLIKITEPGQTSRIKRIIEDTGAGFSRLNKILTQNKLIFNKLNAHFGEETLGTALKNVDDYEDVAIGAKKALENIPSGNLDDFASYLDDIPCVTSLEFSAQSCVPGKVLKAEFITNLGKIERLFGKEVADNVRALQDIPGIERLSKTIATNSNSGFRFEVRASRLLRERGFDISELGKVLKSSSNQDIGEIDALLKNGDILEFKEGWLKNTISSENGKKVIDDLTKKYGVFKTFQSQQGIGSKVFVYSDVVPDPDMKKAIESLGYIVEVL